MIIRTNFQTLPTFTSKCVQNSKEQTITLSGFDRHPLFVQTASRVYTHNHCIPPPFIGDVTHPLSLPKFTFIISNVT